jgi:hypothetical protein
MYGKVTTGISRGRETEGYATCSLNIDGKRYSCNGGGFDMLGTCAAMFLSDRYRDRLMNHYAENLNSSVKMDTYGLHASGYLDGATGFNHVCRIADKIGIKISAVVVKFPRKGHRTIGYNFEDTRAKENAVAGE